MILGIDASNLRGGGGVTHLSELLRAGHAPEQGFDQVIVWGGTSTLELIEDRSWLRKVDEPLLSRPLPFRTLWQRFGLGRLAHLAGCDVLLVPGGSYNASFRPYVTMSRNMLPFEWQELLRYGWDWRTIKMILLRRVQSRTFRNAEGLIFLTDYAHIQVMKVIKHTSAKLAIIPHGINDRFFKVPHKQLPISQFSLESPFRILYVSTIDMYKHQWHVADAVAQLRADGLPVTLDLIGPAYPPALRRLQSVLGQLDPSGDFIQYRGKVSYSSLHNFYAEADMFVFASSCENMPNTLLEGMAAGLPIACSKCGPMPEILGDGGVYFDPEQPQHIAAILRQMVNDPLLRYRLAVRANERAKEFTWTDCANQTFRFLAQVAATSSPRAIKRRRSAPAPKNWSKTNGRI